MKEAIVSYFESDLEPLLPLIPHERIHPIRRGGKKSVVAIVFSNVNHGSIPPYRSASIAIPVTIGKSPAPSFLPLWFSPVFPQFTHPASCFLPKMSYYPLGGGGAAFANLFELEPLFRRRPPKKKSSFLLRPET